MIIVMNFSDYLKGVILLKNSKFAWLLGLMLVVALFLAACGGDKEEGTDTTTDTEDKDATTEEVATDEEQVLNLIMAAEIPTMDSALSN